MRRAGFTLIEILVAVAIGVLVLVLGWEAVRLLTRAERSTDRETSRAMAEARMMDQLLADLRSALRVAAQGKTGYRVTRHVLGRSGIGTAEVTWRVRDGKVVVREVAGEGAQEYDFTGLLDPGEPAFRFRLEKVTDARFTP